MHVICNCTVLAVTPSKDGSKTYIRVFDLDQGQEVPKVTLDGGIDLIPGEQVRLDATMTFHQGDYGMYSRLYGGGFQRNGKKEAA